jgi:hypothetical protein
MIDIILAAMQNVLFTINSLFKWTITFVVVMLVLVVNSLILYWWILTKIFQPETVEDFACWVFDITDRFFEWMYE